MRYDPKIRHRHSIRLQGYDYSQAGAYYITIVTWQRERLFGEVVDGGIQLNPLGEIVRREWFKTAELRQNVELFEDEFVVMPNHVHGIIVITDTGRGDRLVAPTPQPGPAPRSIGAMIAGFKSAVTKRINERRNSPGVPVWQRNYYEHIIRTEQEHQRIYAYILANPLNWENDGENTK